MAHDMAVRRAAMERLIRGEAPGRVAREMGLPYTTVKRWQGVALSPMTESGHEKEQGPAIGAAVGDWLAESLTTGSVLLEELRDPARLRQLNAKELAIMHGTLFDQGWRLLARLQGDPTTNAR